MDTVAKYVVGAKIDSMKKSMGFDGDDNDNRDKEEDKEVHCSCTFLFLFFLFLSQLPFT